MENGGQREGFTRSDALLEKRGSGIRLGFIFRAPENDVEALTLALHLAV